MRLRFALRVALCALTLSVVLTASAHAQRPGRATVEFAAIGAVVLASYEGRDNATQLALPSGVGLVHTSYDSNDLSFLMAEAGPSFDLTRSGSTGMAVGGVLGFLIASNGDTETAFYAGPQGIVRARINDHAVASFQGGLRLFRSSETGIGFFL